MPGRGTSFGSWSLLAGVGVAGVIIGYLAGTAGQSDPEAVAVAERVVERPGAAQAPPPEAAGEPRRAATEPGAPEAASPGGMREPAPPPVALELPPVPRGDGARIALVIDDLGRRVLDVVELSELGVAISFSVLPFESRTADVLEELERRGGEILLHLPMQPVTEADPGPGALSGAMSAAELEAATRWALGAVDGATGVNNHMGSELSADSASMRTILSVVAERDLFFLDSRTSPQSVGYSLALEMGLAAAERQVFLDTEADPHAIRVQFRRLLEIARQRGAAVAIGHPYAETLAVLREEIPLALAAGFEFVPVGSLTNRRPEARATRAHSERKTSTGLD